MINLLVGLVLRNQTYSVSYVCFDFVSFKSFQVIVDEMIRIQFYAFEAQKID